jgi:hypothetical protein
MSRASFDGRPSVSSLFAVEREIAPEPDQLRERVLDRARASLPRSAWARSRFRTRPVRRLSLATAVAAAVALVALCAAAYQAGHRFKLRSSSVPARPPALAPTVVVEPPAQPKQADVQVDELEPSSESSSELSWTAPEPEPAPLHAARVKPPKPVAEAQAYAMELLLLQPALEAVARRDFATSLSAIASHQRRFPAGQLAEEREGLRVKALLGLGRRPEAMHAGALFRERFPHSALLGQIQELLGTPN